MENYEAPEGIPETRIRERPVTSKLGVPSTLSLSVFLAVSYPLYKHARNSSVEFNRDGNCFLLTVMKALQRRLNPFEPTPTPKPYISPPDSHFNWNTFEKIVAEQWSSNHPKIGSETARSKYSSNN